MRCNRCNIRVLASHLVTGVNPFLKGRFTMITLLVNIVETFHRVRVLVERRVTVEGK